MTDNQINWANDAGGIDPLVLTFQDNKYTWPHQYIKGAELRKMFGLAPEQDLYMSLIDPWDDVLIPNEEEIDLARPGIEKFYIRQPLDLRLGDKKYSWDKPFITGIELRKLGEIEEGDEIWLSIAGDYKDNLIGDNERIDLTRPGIEHFYIKKLEVVIRINNVEHKIKRGTYTVAQLKKIGNVKASDEMDALEGHKLTPLDDAATVVIKGGEQFISHVRDGSSS
jgi:hypothetical protein